MYSSSDQVIIEDEPFGTEEDRDEDRLWRLQDVKWGTDEHDELIAALRHDMEFALKGKQERDDMARRAYKAFRCALNPANHNFISKVVDPRWFTSVATAVAREFQALFQSPPFLQYRPRGGSDAAAANALTLLFDMFFQERRPKAPIFELLLQRTLFGTAYAICYWKEDWRAVGRHEDTTEPVYLHDEESGEEVLDPVNGEPIVVSEVPTRKFVTKRQKVCDAPWFDPVHFLHAYPDWESPEVRGSRFFIHERPRSREYVRMMGRSGRWKKKAVEMALESPWLGDDGGELVGQVNSVIRWQEEVGVLSAGSVERCNAGELFIVSERWTERGVTTYLNRTFVVDHRPNPYAHGEIPVLTIKQNWMPGEHFGMSAFEPIEKLLRHLDTMLNAGATEAQLSVHPPLLVGPDVKADQLLFAPGKLWRVNDPMKSVVPLQRPSHGIEIADGQANGARAMIDDALATSEALRGALPGREQTAAAVNTSVQGAGIRMQLNVELFEESFTIPLGDFYRSMICQFLDYEVQLRVTDDPSMPPLQIGPDQLYDLDADTVPTPSSTQAKELELKRLIDLTTMLLNFSQQGIVQNVNFNSLVETIIELTTPRYKSRIIKSPEQVQAEQQQAMMQQQMGGAPPGAPPAPGQAPAQTNIENQRGATPQSSGGRAMKSNDGGTEEMAKDQAEAQTL